MDLLPGSGSAAVAGFVRHEEALAHGDDLMRLKAHALTAVTAVVPATLAWCIGVDRRLRCSGAIGLQAGRADLESAQEWRRYVATVAEQDPLAAAHVAHAGATVLALADLGADQGRALRAFLAARRLGDRADLYLRHAGGILAQFALLRCETLPGFGRSELTALRRLQPLLEHAFATGFAPDAGVSRAGLLERGLSGREADVAELVAHGATNAEIGRALHIGEATVKTHLTRIFSKLGVRSRTQLALLLGGRAETATSG